MTDDKHIEEQETMDQVEPETEPADPMEVLQAERDQLADKILRMAAEHENYKKRTERENSEFLKRANQNLVGDLLGVLDNLERALEAAEEAGGDQSMVKGLAMIYQELSAVLQRHGLETIEALGQPFDPEYHEAMMQQEDPDQPQNTVINQVQKGYLFQDRLLRPAMVVVSKLPSSSD